jgi:lipid-A-disaccharide synthase
LSLRLLLSCGEASGDLYAGALTRELKALAPGLEIAGLGGPEFSRAGGQVLVDYRGLSVTGFTEIVSKVPQLRAAKERLLAEAKAGRVDALVVIDYFGFNGRLARGAKALGIPVIYYISPQIWAWRPKRITLIKEVASRVLVIFPFEEAISRTRARRARPCSAVSGSIRMRRQSRSCQAAARANCAASCRRWWSRRG